MLGEISQSNWFVSTFVAEGFNVDPVSGDGVFDAAISIEGPGTGWPSTKSLRREDSPSNTPYVDPDGVPLTREEMLSRPGSDPLFVDVASYSNFLSPGRGLHCDHLFQRQISPLQLAERAYGREPGESDALHRWQADLLELHQLCSLFPRPGDGHGAGDRGVSAAEGLRPLPPSTGFVMGPAPPASEGFNALPGVEVRVSEVDADARPVGGVRFPEAKFPRGRPIPPALSPVSTSSINETCGNYTGFELFDEATLVSRGLVGAAHRRDVKMWAAHLETQGYLLAEDLTEVVEAALR